MNKKLIYITIGILLTVIILLVSYLYFVAPWQFTKFLEKTALEKNFVTQSEFRQCLERDCDNFYVLRITDGLRKNLLSIGSEVDIEDQIEEIKRSLDENNILKTKREIKNLLTKVEEILKSYEVEHNFSTEDAVKAIKGDIKSDAIGGDDFRIINIRAISGYLIAAVVPTKDLTDPASIILKKKGQKYELIAGPGTHFEYSYLIERGVPLEVTREANQILPGS